VDLLTILMLFAAGIGGGILTGVIGGAALVTFPALLAAGLPPINAAACNLFALIPANVVVVATERALLPPANRLLFGLLATSALGSAIGATLLVFTPGRTFEILVPLLLGFATVLLAFSPQLSAWFRRGRSGAAARSRVSARPVRRCCRSWCMAATSAQASA